MISTAIKDKIVAALEAHRENYTSDSKHARVLGINSAQYSRIKKGEYEKIISEQKWYSLARILEVPLKTQKKWVTVQTDTLKYVTTQLELCQQNSFSAILCDEAGIGKTHAGMYYAKHHRNAIYIDCSQVKSKQRFLRRIAREFGLNHTGRYAEVYDELVFYLNNIEKPLIILDEAGDLQYPAFLELKALWNATEYSCGWYMMGADGLQHKMNRQRDLKKVGYAEILDRYGNIDDPRMKSRNKITPVGKSELKQFKMRQLSQICKANKSEIPPVKMYAMTMGSLRKVREIITKPSVN